MIPFSTQESCMRQLLKSIIPESLDVCLRGLTANMLSSVHELLTTFLSNIADSSSESSLITSLSAHVDAIISSLRPVLFEASLKLIAERTLLDYSDMHPNATIVGHQSRKLITAQGLVRLDCYKVTAGSRANAIAPIQAALGISSCNVQSDLIACMIKTGILLPLSEARLVMSELRGIDVCHGTIHSHLTRFGEKISNCDVLPEKAHIDKLIADFRMKYPDEKVEIVISADGCMEPMRHDDAKRKGPRGKVMYKEVKGFRCWLVSSSGKIQHIATWHGVANEADFGVVLTLFKQKLPELCIPMLCVADGAGWIWKYFTALFPDATTMIDLWHVLEKIEATLKLHIKSDDTRKEKSKEIRKLLDTDCVQEIIRDITILAETETEQQQKDKDSAAKLLTYLEDKKGRMMYETFSKTFKTRGSGAMESSNKYICHKRLKLCGASWKSRHANAVLRLRCAFANKTLGRLLVG